MRRIACALIGIALLIGLPAAAQGNSLSAADQALLAAANGALPDSFAFDYTTQLAVQGLNTFALAADLSGSGALDRSAPALNATLKGTITAGTAQQIPVDAEFRWLNDTLYLNPGDGWQALPSASTFITQIMDYDLTLSADPGAIAHWDFASIGGVSDILTALATADPASFLSAQRLPDESGAAHFQISINLSALMQTDAFVTADQALAQAQGTDLIIFDHAHLAQINATNSALFSAATLNLDEYIGLDDHLIHRLVISLQMPLDPSKLGYVDAPFTVSASFDLTLRGQNQPQALSVPDGAKTVSQLSFGAPPTPPAPDAGLTQYLYLETIGEDATYTRTFAAKAGDHVTITALGIGLSFDGQAALLSSAGGALAQNDDHEANVFGVGAYDPQIADFTIPADGTYTVQIKDAEGTPSTFVLTIAVRR